MLGDTEVPCDAEGDVFYCCFPISVPFSSKRLLRYNKYKIHVSSYLIELMAEIKMNEKFYYLSSAKFWLVKGYQNIVLGSQKLFQKMMRMRQDFFFNKLQTCNFGGVYFNP